MKALNHALLIGNGKITSCGRLQELAQRANYIVAADGGADHARRAGVVPDVIIGDLDSVSPSARKQFASSQWVFVDKQNNTDLQKALDYLIKHKCKKCTLIGFDGGRPDFTLGNLLALYPYARKMDWCVEINGWQIYPLIKTKTFNARPGARVSLLPLTPCSGVTLAGLKFPLTNARLPLGTTRTLSNVSLKKRFTVNLQKGFLLVYLEI